MSSFSIENILSHSSERFRIGTLLCCVQKISGSEKVFDKKGGRSIKILSRKIFVSQCRKIS